jgi:hypothetical protein
MAYSKNKPTLPVKSRYALVLWMSFCQKGSLSKGGSQLMLMYDTEKAADVFNVLKYIKVR